MAYIYGSIWDRFNRNALNKMSEEVETIGKSIQDLVAEGQLTPAQYAELIKSVNSLASHTELDKKRDKDIKITPEDLSDSALSLVTGEGVIELNSIPQDGSVKARTLSSTYNHKGSLSNNDDLNHVVDSGFYVFAGSNNAPANLPSGLLSVESSGNFVTQTVQPIQGDGDKVYRRLIKPIAGEYLPWFALHTEELKDESVKSRMLSSTYNHRPNLSNNDDLNHVVDTGFYVFVGSNNAPADLPSGLLSVESSGAFVIQTVQTIQGNGGQVYRRLIKPNAEDYLPWFSLHNQAQVGLGAKIIVNLGDSIFGNTRGANSISNHISERTGATVHNIGFGGTRIAEHFAGWDAFSLYRLADEIVKDDTDTTKWQLQEAGIIDDAGGAKASYFREHLDLLKSIDFNQVDYVTIAGGTNDYTSSVLLDNDSNKYDTTTFAGSLRYSLEKIMGEFKHLKILLCTPTYRFWMDENGAFVEDSDTRLYGGQGLPDFVQKEIEVAREYHIPVVDNYFELGINKFNRQEFFPSNDGTHPNPKGNEKLGSRIGSKLISEF